MSTFKPHIMAKFTEYTVRTFSSQKSGYWMEIIILQLCYQVSYLFIKLLTMFAVIDQLSYQLPDLVDNKVSFLLSQLVTKLIADLLRLLSIPSAHHCLLTSLNCVQTWIHPQFHPSYPKLPQANTNLFPLGLC